MVAELELAPQLRLGRRRRIGLCADAERGDVDPVRIEREVRHQIVSRRLGDGDQAMRPAGREPHVRGHRARRAGLVPSLALVQPDQVEQRHHPRDTGRHRRPAVREAVHHVQAAPQRERGKRRHLAEQVRPVREANREDDPVDVFRPRLQPEVRRRLTADEGRELHAWTRLEQRGRELEGVAPRAGCALDQEDEVETDPHGPTVPRGP